MNSRLARGQPQNKQSGMQILSSSGNRNNSPRQFLINKYSENYIFFGVFYFLGFFHRGKGTWSCLGGGGGGDCDFLGRKIYATPKCDSGEMGL